MLSELAFSRSACVRRLRPLRSPEALCDGALAQPATRPDVERENASTARVSFTELVFEIQDESPRDGERPAAAEAWSGLPAPHWDLLAERYRRQVGRIPPACPR